LSKDIVFVFCSPAATSFGVPYYLCFVQSSTHEKGLSQQELHEALTGQSQKTPEGSKHKARFGEMVGMASRMMVMSQSQPLRRWSPDGVLLALQQTLSQIVDSGREVHQHTYDVL